MHRGLKGTHLRQKKHLKSSKSLCKQSWQIGNTVLTADEHIHLRLHFTVITDGSEMCYTLHNPNINKELMRCCNNEILEKLSLTVTHTYTHRELSILCKELVEVTLEAGWDRQFEPRDWAAEFWALGHGSVWPTVLPGNTAALHRCKCNCRWPSRH